MSFIVPISSHRDVTIKDDQKCRALKIATYVACHTSINVADDLSDILENEVGAQDQVPSCDQVCFSLDV